MKKIMPLCMSIMLILIAGMFAGAGTMAYFNDTEEVGQHTMEAGTLDLEVGSSAPITISIQNIAPGWSKTYSWTLTNTGSITGVVKVEFSPVTEYENGENEPESIAEDMTFTPAGCGPQTVGIEDSGELGYFLKANGRRGWIYPGIGGWQVGVPCPNSWAANGYGLHACGGNTYLLGRTYEEAKLGPGESCTFTLELSLDENLRTWDGCGWHDIDDNVIQSDSVEFTIIFHLEQVEPYQDETSGT